MLCQPLALPISLSPPAQALPGLAEATALLAQVAATPVEDLDIGLTNRHLPNAASGPLAVALRRHMCGGPDAAMLRGETLNMVFPAFAALGHGQGSRELHHYKAWVHKLATKEYADELVVLATAHELNVEITCVPFTPYNSPRPWTISKYAPPCFQRHAASTCSSGEQRRPLHVARTSDGPGSARSRTFSMR